MVFFTTEETGDIEIGLKTGTADGDHWTVWRSFKIELVPDAARAAALYAYESALAAADALLADDANVGDNLFQIAQDSYDALANTVTDKSVDTDVATVEELNAATEALLEAAETYKNSPVNQPEEGVLYSFQQKATGFYLALDAENDKVMLAESETGFTFVATEGGYYLTNENGAVGLLGTNAWTMSANPDNALAITAVPVIIDGELYYTLKEKNGLIASDGTNAGDACFADKGTGMGDRAYWKIGKYDPDSIKAVETVDENTAIYDLAGRRVSKAVKGGIYIINGKKVVVK